MSRQKKPRNKKYHPRLASIPVTGLADEFGMVLQTGLAMALAGQFTWLQFDRVGNAINTIGMSFDIKAPKDPSIARILEGTVRAMNTVSKRGDRTGNWNLTLEERAALRAGVIACERQLPKMDVTALYLARQKIIAMSEAEWAENCSDPEQADVAA